MCVFYRMFLVFVNPKLYVGIDCEIVSLCSKKFVLFKLYLKQSTRYCHTSEMKKINMKCLQTRILHCLTLVHPVQLVSESYAKEMIN